MNRRQFLAKTAAGGALLVGGQWMGRIEPAVAATKIPVGWAVGQRAPVLAGPDQYMRSTSVRTYVGAWTFLDVSAFWCGPCLESAGNHRAFREYVNGQGVPLEILTVLSESPTPGKPATQADAERWASTFGLEHEVILHCDGNAKSRLFSLVTQTGTANGNPTPGYPTYLLIDPNGIVRYYQADANLDLIQAQLSSLTGVPLTAVWTPLSTPRPSFGPGLTEGTVSFTLLGGPAVSQTVHIGSPAAGDVFTLDLTEARRISADDIKVLLKLVDTSQRIDPLQPISVTLRPVGFGRTYTDIPRPTDFNSFLYLLPDLQTFVGADTLDVAYSDDGTAIVVAPETAGAGLDFNAYELDVTFDFGHPPYSLSLTLDAVVRAEPTLTRATETRVVNSLKAGRHRLTLRDYDGAATSMEAAADTLLAAGARTAVQDIADNIAAHTRWLADHA